MGHEKRCLVDLEEKPPHPESVKVLCLGMCRTGTKSLLTALKMLGYSPIHMSLIRPYQHKMNLWIEALEHTFVHERPPASFDRPEFGILLKGHDAVLDVPCAVFAEQLVKAYHDAKAIFTFRAASSWIASMQSTVWQIMLWPSYKILRYLDPYFLGPFVRLVELICWVHNGNVYGGEDAEMAFARHNKRVKELVPADRLLEFEPPCDWQTLCTFLDQPVSGEQYPHINETSEFAANLYIFRKTAILNTLSRISKVFIFLLPALSSI